MKVELNSREQETLKMKINDVLIDKIKKINVQGMMERIELNVAGLLLEKYKKNINIFKKEIRNDYNTLVKKYETFIKILIDKPYAMHNLKFFCLDIEKDEKVDAEEYVIKYYKDRNFDIVSRFTRYNTSINKKEFVYFPSNLQAMFESKHSFGRPDLFVLDKESGRFFLVEVKTGDDGLRHNQGKWIATHPGIEVVVFYLNQNLLHLNLKYREIK